jgi:DNA recombination protein RmuC
VAYGWRQDRVAESAQAISELGKALYSRLRLLGEHFQEIQKHLERTNAAYNRAAATLESRVFASARRFKELGAGVGGDLETPPVLDNAPRSIHALELALPYVSDSLPEAVAAND